MNARRLANPAQSLLTLIEQRFDLRLPTQSAEHLARVREHYLQRRKLLLWEHGEAAALAKPDYAKCVLISEAARLLLREIDPWPRRKHAKKGTPPK
jgi:hypothetical protein